MARKPRKKINRDVDTPQQTESESTADIGSVDSPAKEPLNVIDDEVGSSVDYGKDRAEDQDQDHIKSDRPIIDMGAKKKPVTKATDLSALKKYVQLSFVIFFLAGCLAIYLFQGNNKWLAIASPITVMFLYILFTWNAVKEIRTANVLFADSVYYMGFLFTFVTLVFAITTNNIEFDVIINQMGVALSTTVIGMFVRVMLSHFDGIELNAGDDIYANMAKTASKITLITDRLIQSSTDQLNQIQDSTKKAEEVSDNLQLVISNLSNLDFPLDKFNNINKQVDEVGASLESFNGSISGSANKVNAIAESLSVVSEITEKISLFKLKVDELNKLQDDLSSYVGDVQSGSSSIGSIVEGLTEKVEDAKREIDEHMKNAERLESSVSYRLQNIINLVNK